MIISTNQIANSYYKNLKTSLSIFDGILTLFQIWKFFHEIFVETFQFFGAIFPKITEILQFQKRI